MSETDREKQLAELRQLRADLTKRLAEIESASATARGVQVDELRRVLGCAPGETMLEAAKRLVLERDGAVNLASANAQWARHYQRERERRDVAVAEADELRRLAWEWCITARHFSSQADTFMSDEKAAWAAHDKLRAENDDLRAQLRRLTEDAVRRGAKLGDK